ncbi:MAG: hypothetical protein ACK5P7_00985 [Bdellovibrio sp.]
MLRKTRFLSAVSLLFVLTAFTRPQTGDLVELEGLVNARENAKFRSHDQNRVYMLPAGTKAQIEQVQHFAGTGNFGVRIRLINAAGVKEQHSKSLWVYYNVKNPSMKLYSVSGDENQLRQTLDQWKTSPRMKALEVRDPGRASAVVTTRETPAVAHRSTTSVPVVKPAPAARAPRYEGPGPVRAADVIGTVGRLNQVTRQYSPPVPECRDCSVRPAQYEQCNARNNYLEQQMDRLQGQPILRELLSTTPRYPRVEACVRESMNISGGPFTLCQIGNADHSGSTVKACTSSRLVRVVQNALTASVDCLAPYLNGTDGNQAVLSETFRSTIALINLESGFHINARSSTGASGLGQITDGATKAINQNEWSNMMRHIQNSSNPSCQQLKRMNLQPARPSRGAVCDRIGLESGNPMTNMLYTIGHMKSVRREVELTVNRKIRENSIRMSPAQKEKLLGALITWGHNTGAYGITRPVSSLLETDAGIRALNAGNVEGFLGLLKGEVSSFHGYYLARRGMGAQAIQRRQTEASGFYQYVQNKMNLLERKVGRQCSL